MAWEGRPVYNVIKESTERMSHEGRRSAFDGPMTTAPVRGPVDMGMLLSEAKASLESALGERLRGLVLYGSQARREAEKDSDLDLMVLLDGPVELVKDLKTMVDALYPLQLEIERPIHLLPVEWASFESGEFAIYRNAKREGIML